jgi:chorismate-pyruvate lyase
MGTTAFVRKYYPTTTFHLEKRVTHAGKMVRRVRFELDGEKLVHARSEVNLSTSKPGLVRLLHETSLPLGEIVRRFNVRRTRLRSTTRTREFHFVGDLHAKVWERFYVCRKTGTPLMRESAIY